jgi:two-component system response regulator YesN
MFQVIFVDDEKIVREGMETRVPWESLGYQLMGTFADGVDALDFLEQNPVDLVVSDISMPRMDGLALSKILAEQYPQTTTILLTGYDDFEYAQEAIKHGVKELLLKPMNSQEFGQVLEGLTQDLKEKQQSQEEERLFREALETTLPLLRERFLLSLILGYITPEEAQRRQDFYRWKDRGQTYAVVLLHFLKHQMSSDIQRIRIKQLLEQVTLGEANVIVDRNEDLILLIQLDQTTLEAQNQKLREIGHHLLKQINSMQTGSYDNQDTPVCLGIGPPVPDLKLLPQTYSQAKTTLDRLIILGLPGILSWNELTKQRVLSAEEFHSLVRTLLKQLKEETSPAVLETLNRVFSYLEDSGVSRVEVEGYTLRLQFIFLDFLEELNLSEDQNHQRLVSTLRHPQSFDTIGESREFFHQIILGIDQIIQVGRNFQVHSRIQKAKDLIHQRYQDKGFSLQDMCNELFLSVSQFSALFKSGTGRTFVEYLTETRINQAKILLKTTDKKNFEIAEEVGYEDPRYFSLLFKKLTGQTPGEYRKALDQ